jgi:predicted acylesterase/phospholipase RssA
MSNSLASRTNGIASGARAAGGPTIALALAGGGPEGAIYEIGALRALEEALDGDGFAVDFTELPLYVGVSAGAFVGACLVNGISTAQLCRGLVVDEPGETPFRPGLFLTPAFGEWIQRGASVPRHLLEAVADYLFKHDHEGGIASALVGRLGRALPVGLFNNDGIRIYLETVFAAEGRTDDFRALDARLRIVASDLNSGAAVRFGEPGYEHVPISLAVQASTALPVLYPPVCIDEREYVDGVLLKTVHASVALDAGADIVLCVNPIVPVDTARAVEEGIMRRGKLIDRGMPGVLAQTFRTLIHSRLTTGIAAYEDRYRDADVVLFEPRRDDYEMFFTNVFSFDSRKAVVEHAYHATLESLAERREALAPILARHGLRLRDDVLDNPAPRLWPSVGLDLMEEPAQMDDEDRGAPVARTLRDVLARLDATVEQVA